ncbi:Nematode cuticle collagen N-terminal domain-containing protein [Caenorhabditis elegans]|uniref:Nematode cuticle collagen N-terminal domain-containing protein n=1 Tax=Caenorhabditis elegans TaxID=6239 RepID=Q21047_CAEEL|nr:Nematode cuticle collagen N-terminal domain-containing protein [Caenorhabditis elegans]CAA90658.1 Nematode cuticle collagen N-terminal domain-containing protein [Caenorhabditis elegans]|eukprot:NP_509766.1 Uncharacterized protein CELE_F59F5.4 [Caenorhabditis elegans]
MHFTRKYAYQTVLAIAATLSIISVITIFMTFPCFYTYFARVKMDLQHEMKFCKKSAEKVFYFVNEVGYFDRKREMSLDISQCQVKNPRSFLLE